MTVGELRAELARLCDENESAADWPVVLADAGDRCWDVERADAERDVERADCDDDGSVVTYRRAVVIAPTV